MIQFCIVNNPEKTGWYFGIGINYYITSGNHNWMFHIDIYKHDYCLTFRLKRK